tara:strand:+ start:347 stop:742 length:396 start_codon:yes stop_codon:yes gene_type:complete
MINITRFALFSNRTLGRLKIDDLELWTIERPWQNNLPFKSCIPDGEYKIKLTDSPRFGPGTWQVQDVPDRTHILFHVANTADDVVGCIGCGLSLYPDLNGVGNSRKAMEKFDSYLAGLDKTDLVIKTGPIM